MESLTDKISAKMSEVTRKAVYKYELPFGKKVKVALPCGAEILTIQPQYDKVQIWALVDIEETETWDELFDVVGTGTPMDFDLFTSREYLATVQLQGGDLVYHVFRHIDGSLNSNID